MNCDQFHQLVRDLIDERLTDAGERERAIAHAANCSVCNARLESERELSSGLRALVAADRDESASSLMEVRLRAAFKQRHAASAGAPAGFRPARWLAWAGIAAAVVVLILMAAYLLRKTSHELPQSRPEEATRQDQPPHQEPAPVPESPKRAPYRAANNPVRRSAVAKASTQATTQAPTQEQQPVEVATRFIPLTRGGDAPAVDSWRLVRAEVPKSSLTVLGLPVNWESPDDRVKADFLVGNDGLAYAVRFVR